MYIIYKNVGVGKIFKYFWKSLMLAKAALIIHIVKIL